MMNSATQKAATLDDELMQLVRERVYKHSGICLEKGKEHLIESRLRRRLRVLNMDEPSAYLVFLDDHPEEYEHFVNVFTTNETSFFRTLRVWRYIEQTLLPVWARDQSKLRNVWSAASSTGEEAFSLAMACEHFNGSAGSSLKLKITGSDISTDVVAKAKRAVYSGRTINRLQAARPEFLLNYFCKNGDEYSLRPVISKAVQFRQHNLFKNPPFKEHYDLVMLRNVLIYFSEKDQERVLSNIHRSLKPGGVLIVGESESLANLNTAFEYCEPLIYKKKG